jgi:uncharacterized membrane protein HdeD (DUF308 family)
VVVLDLSPDDVRRARTWLLVTGILAILAGAAAIAVPAVASVTIALLVGWILLVVGIVMAMHVFSSRPPGHRGLWIANTVLTLFVALHLLLFPLSGR